MPSSKVFKIDNNLFFIGSTSMRSCSNAIRLLEANPSISNFIISSPGGHLTAAIALCEAIRIRSYEYPLNIRVQGEACSSATLILASCKGLKEMTKNSYLMYHLPYKHSSTSVSSNSHSQRDLLAELTFVEKIMESIIVTDNKSRSFYNKFTSMNKDFYVSPGEALNLGLIDRIV